MTGGASGSSVREQRNVPLQCPKLTDTNYTTWALMMETILKAYGLWKVIDETDGKKETSGKQETAIDEKAENTAKGMIFQTLPQDMLMPVAQYTTAKETLRSELETLKMKPNESANEFAGKLSSIQAKFKSLGGTLKDKVLVRKLLNSVPKKFLPIVASIEQYQEIDTMQFEEANLSSSGLSGEIADALANFTMINLLDLSYNNLSESVPKFLASLDFLKTLNLTGNNFTRPLPAKLLAKSKKGSLLLMLAPYLMIITPIKVLETLNANMPSDIVGARNQRFTFLETQNITDSFNTAIGKGGFETVFYGSIGNNQVAVKMLFESSTQGYKEFQAE
nr:zinc finger, CCHC-type [Tanacetum cinerariifolium]